MTIIPAGASEELRKVIWLRRSAINRLRERKQEELLREKKVHEAQRELHEVQNKVRESQREIETLSLMMQRRAAGERSWPENVPDALVAVFAELPDEFTIGAVRLRFDRLFPGWLAMRDPSALSVALLRMVKDGRLLVHESGSGSRGTVYRKPSGKFSKTADQVITEVLDE